MQEPDSNRSGLRQFADITLAANEPFRFTGLAESGQPTPASPPSSLVWQPLRATFRPLNRPTSTSEPEETAGSLTGAGSTTTTTPSPPTTLSSLIESAESLDDEQPTRVPLSRFRPTKAPSVDPIESPIAPFAVASGSQQPGGADNATSAQLDRRLQTSYQITSECFECICEASTNCNLNSRCQTSDVRHTRCGLFLISYDQWLETGLSKQLVSREALAKDAAADERAFYECVTSRQCAERLLALYMQRHLKDCDKDGRLDCYDVAAIHQGGPGVDQCQSESLLDSQYWSDFNACFGFGAR